MEQARTTSHGKQRSYDFFNSIWISHKEQFVLVEGGDGLYDAVREALAFRRRWQMMTKCSPWLRWRQCGMTVGVKQINISDHVRLESFASQTSGCWALLNVQRTQVLLYASVRSVAYRTQHSHSKIGGWIHEAPLMHWKVNLLWDKDEEWSAWVRHNTGNSSLNPKFKKHQVDKKSYEFLLLLFEFVMTMISLGWCLSVQERSSVNFALWETKKKINSNERCTARTVRTYWRVLVFGIYITVFDDILDCSY